VVFQTGAAWEGHDYLVDKVLKSGHFAECPNKGCKYKRELEPVAG